MTKLTKRIRTILEKVDITKQYDIYEVLSLLKENSSAKFVESIDASINTGIDSRKPEQIIKGSTILPHGTGRTVRVAVFTQESNIEKAKQAGADLVGMEDLAEKIKKKEVNFNVVIASPDAMYVVNQLGQLLGPRGLMPSLKFGTITSNITTAVENAKKGQIFYRNDKNGIVHSTIGKTNFDLKKLKENLEALLFSIKKDKPIQAKGIFFKKISISTTMGVGILVNQESLIATNLKAKKVMFPR